MTIATCAPAWPEAKGGSEATAKLAKADVVLKASPAGGADPHGVRSTQYPPTGVTS